MPRPLRLLFLLVSAFVATAPALRAHEPLESTASIHRTQDCLEVSAVLSPATALLLLPADARSLPLQKENFALHREALTLAAPSICSLLGADGTVIPPTQVIVTLNPGDEVYFFLVYPVDARPALLRMAYLDTQPPGAFCSVTDFTATPERHSILRQTRLDHAFAAPASPSL